MQWAYGSSIRSESRQQSQQHLGADPAGPTHAASQQGVYEHPKPSSTSNPSTPQLANGAEGHAAQSNGPEEAGKPRKESLHGTPHSLEQPAAGMSSTVPSSNTHTVGLMQAPSPHTPALSSATSPLQHEQRHLQAHGTHQQEQQQKQIEELQHKVHVLTKQLSDALANRRGLVKGGLDSQSLSSPGIISGGLLNRSGPAHGSLDNDAFERLQLRLQKAEKALEHERKHSETLRQQVEVLEARQQEAAQQHAAASTIPMLQSELLAARSLGEQRTREAAALQRAVMLGDETISRLRGQLAGLLEANKEAIAREQESERQVAELHTKITSMEQQLASQQQQLVSQQQQLAAQHQHHKQQLSQQQEQHAQQLAAARDHSNRARSGSSSGQVALQTENQDLRGIITQLEGAVQEARAESARKDAGIRALEALLSRMPSQTGAVTVSGAGASVDTAQPGTPGAALPATVTIDMFMGDPATSRSMQGPSAAGLEAVDNAAAAAAAAGLRQPEGSLPGGLNESQWKLVMLSEAIRGLRTTVMRLRHQQAQQQQQQVAQAGAGVQTVVGIGAAEGQGGGEGEGGVVMEVVEVDLPEEEISARVSQLAAQMLVLEEELQQLRSSSTNDNPPESAGANTGTAGGAAVTSVNSSHITGKQQAPGDGNGLSSTASDARAEQQTVEVSIQHASKDATSKPDTQHVLVSKPERRRGWLFGWWFGSKETSPLHEV